LTELLKANVKFAWTSACQKAFDKVKRLLTTAPVLRLPDWHSNKPFDMVCDASLKGIAGVLLQDNQPIAYESRKLKAAEMNYSPTELEMLAVVYCVKKWRCYIEGRDVNVFTDHKPNTFFDTSTMQSRRAARWLEELQGHRLKWNYKPGRQNVVADALSRHPANISYIGLLQATDDPLQTVTKDNTFLSSLKEAYKLDSYFQDEANLSNLTVKDDLYYRNDTLVMPNDHTLKNMVLAECHDTPYCGHAGRTKTMHNVHALLLVAWHAC